MISKQTEKLKYHSLNFKLFFKAFWKVILIWILLVTFVVLAIHFHVDKTIIGVAVLAFGLASQAFIGLINIIALIPFIGPIIAKVLALPIYWLINSVGYFLSLVAIKKGYKKEVINYRVLTVVFLLGIVAGYILGKIF